MPYTYPKKKLPNIQELQNLFTFEQVLCNLLKKLLFKFC